MSKPGPKARKAKTERKRESSSALFLRLRPKFLDWRPQTEEERALEAKARRDERDAQLKKVTELEKARQAQKSAARKSSRGAVIKNK